MTDRAGGGRAQRRPEEKRARLVDAARTIFGEIGYEASVHQICRAAGVGIGTFYHQFPDKAELMRYLMEEEHCQRSRAFDALPAQPANEFSAEVVRVLSGSDPALLRAMIDACGIDARLRDFGRDLRKETRQRLAAAIERLRQARGSRRAALDASTVAWAILALSDAGLTGDIAKEVSRIIDILALA
jgi:AcrR family transcriptional regulator